MNARVLALLLCCAATLSAQRVEEFRDLATRAVSAPPEYAADLMIRLGARQDVPAAERIEWLVRAFELAGGAHLQRPTPLPISPLQLVNGASFASLTRPKLDTFSLRSETVRMLVPLDRERSRELFRALSPPPSSPCLAERFHSTRAPITPPSRRCSETASPRKSEPSGVTSICWFPR